MLSCNLEKSLHRALGHANERRHEYATIEHLLLALTEDKDAVAVLRACSVDLDRLRREVLSYVDSELGNLVAAHGDDAKPTASLQRTLQRAAIHVQSSGREEVTGANVLVAMFAERQSHAVYFLEEQKMTRFDAVNYISHGISKIPGHQGEVRLSDIAEQIRTSWPTSDSEITAQTDVKESSRARIFISYSHTDLRWISRLDVHLKPIVDNGLVARWDDRQIKPGSKWREEIRLAINAASIAILFISADYLASEFITKDELPPLLRAAEEKGCQILPIIVSPCRYLRTLALAEFQAINSPSRPLTRMSTHEREALFSRVAEVIEDALV
jgi:hypothetical protein